MLPCTFNPLNVSGGLNYAPQAPKPAFLDFDRIHFGTVTAPMPIAGGGLLSPYGLQGPFGNWDPVTAATMKALKFSIFDAHHGHFIQEEPKPQHSYIGLIAMAILSSVDKKMVLCDIYQWILDHYPYFRSRGPGWRNSIRHNLSLNDCFIKAGRSANGKGHYWAIHPANVDDFKRGDFRRRRAQRKVRKHMGLTGAEDGENSDDSPCPSPTSVEKSSSGPCLAAELSKENELEINTISHSAISCEGSSRTDISTNGNDNQQAEPRRHKRLFDVESLLAPDVNRSQSSNRVGQQTSLISSEEVTTERCTSPLNFSGALTKLTNIYSTIPGQQQNQAAAEASTMIFNPALSVWNLCPAAAVSRVAPYGSWSSHPCMHSAGQPWTQSVANVPVVSEHLPSLLSSKPEQHRSPSPYSAAKWQETFAKIMARSYHWRNNPVVSKGTSTTSGSQHTIDSSAGRHM
uniref:Fork-head domain-containing protein n=2 Tax=Trichuris muris TaxID=70415 RepID=A0A5S6QFM2_TRIMR